jgi:16S rRNA (guanine527-N7)-methyltransferase
VNEADSDTLNAALARHGVSLAEDRAARLDEYCRLLWDYNTRLNLTRHTDYEKFVARDLIDSMQLATLLEPGQTVLDLGTGGGVPGVVVAILRDDVRVAVCDSVAKKANAVKAIVEAMKLPVRVLARRAEEILAGQKFDVVVARAVGPLWKILRWLKPHWSAVGSLLVVKGPRWVEERGEARHRGYLADMELRKAAEYDMPGTKTQSVVLRIWPEKPAEPAEKPRPPRPRGRR